MHHVRASSGERIAITEIPETATEWINWPRGRHVIEGHRQGKLTLRRSRAEICNNWAWGCIAQQEAWAEQPGLEMKEANFVDSDRARNRSCTGQLWLIRRPHPQIALRGGNKVKRSIRSTHHGCAVAIKHFCDRSIRIAHGDDGQAGLKACRYPGGCAPIPGEPIVLCMPCLLPQQIEPKPGQD